MSNARVIGDNAAERCTIAASSVSGLLAAANLLTDDKSMVYRSAADVTSVTLTGTTTVTEFASCFALLFSNLSPTNTIRVRLYSDTAGTSLVLDTGVVNVAWPARTLRGWTAAQAASAYFNGGGTHAVLYFASTGFKKYVVDVVDTNNLQGYIEAGRALISTYWSPAINPTAAPSEVIDSTRLEVNDAGGQVADAGHIRRKLTIELNDLSAADRTTMANMVANSASYPILIDMYPLSSDLSLRRDNIVYGRREPGARFDVQHSVRYGTSLTVAEI